MQDGWEMWITGVNITVSGQWVWESGPESSEASGEQAGGEGRLGAACMGVDRRQKPDAP